MNKETKCYCGHTTICDCEPLKESKQETIEEAAERLYPISGPNSMWNSLQQDGFIKGAKWQQEQDNKELDMWKLAVEKQEARCTALRGVISDLQEKMYSEKEVYNLLCSMPNFYNMTIPQQIKVRDKWFEQFKKK